MRVNQDLFNKLGLLLYFLPPLSHAQSGDPSTSQAQSVTPETSSSTLPGTTQAQSATTSASLITSSSAGSSITTSSSSASSSLSVAVPTPSSFLPFYIPTISGDLSNTQIIDAFSTGKELFAFSIYFQRDYPMGLNPDMETLISLNASDWRQCAQSCVTYNLDNTTRGFYYCDGITIRDEICNIRGAIAESSIPIDSPETISGILHLIDIS